MKRLNIILLCVMLCTAGCTDKEPPIIESGTTGVLTWQLFENGTLIISGKGEMPDYMNTIGEANVPWGMYKNEITSVIIGNGVSKVSSHAFVNCSNLTSVTIGKSVTFIGDIAFLGGSLTSINVDNDNTVYSSKNGVLFNKTKTTLVQYPPGKTNASYTIPNSVTSIKNLAFLGCRNLTSVAIPNSIKSIGNNAFNGCSGLTSVTIPNSITIIESFTFRSCSKLTSIIIPNSVTSIENGAFYNCDGLRSVTIPNSVKSIGIEAFGNCAGLTSINVDNNNTSYSSEDGVLFNKTKTNLIIYPTAKTGAYTIPNSAKSIEDYAFAECIGLTSVIIPNSVIDIGIGVFYGCFGLTSVSIGNSVKSIGESAFQSCHGLSSIIISNSVTSIGSYAFFGCAGLMSLTIGNSVNTIGRQTFSFCIGLKEVINESTTPQDISANVFYNSNIPACTLRVPEASLSTYHATDGWKNFGKIAAI